MARGVLSHTLVKSDQTCASVLSNGEMRLCRLREMLLADWVGELVSPMQQPRWRPNQKAERVRSSRS